ncbi:MAG: VacB/RNase II family 3'-5' exoribonuclease, partial [Clostridia bacterium]|nr:VacB/RNase II family 3'-5' exoribonuclease [Clostridia bacterium]
KKQGRHSAGVERHGQQRTVCAVIRIVSRSVTHVTGTLYRELPRFKKGAPRYFIEADNDRITAMVQIRPSDLGDAQPGDRIEVEIIKYPKPDYPSAQGRVTRVFGDTESKEANYAVILHENRIPTEFPEAVLDAAARAAARPITENGRLDLRGSVIFTIDSEDAKDLDDAISLEKTENGWLLGVHIADVAEYVRQNSAVDAEAYARGTSVYFVDSVVPMLPKVLSNGICSLNGGEDRYALSALISLDHNGTILGCECRETVIRSCIRGVYSELNDILANGAQSQYYEKYGMLFPHVYPQMVQLYEILDSKNRARGALELETAEPRFILDEKGYPRDIVRRDRGVSERLIEQFMLCANEAVATWLSAMQMPCIYRIHEEPVPEKLQAFITFSHNLGLDVRPLKRRQLRSGDLQAVMNEARERGLDGVLSTVMLRSLSKARYSRVQNPHFGLAAECYCHFTSPIRRYPDLCVHRFVKAILHGELDAHSAQKTEVFAEKAALQSTECEIRAMMAERSIEDLYKVLYLEDKIGEEFVGTVSSVASFGFFVALDNTCEGLVPIGDLDGFYTYDE